jgi:hypothetical protein
LAKVRAWPSAWRWSNVGASGNRSAVMKSFGFKADPVADVAAG